MWQDVHQIQIQGRSAGWWYQGHEGPVREKREVGEGTARDRKLRARWEAVLGVQVQAMEYAEVPEGTGKGEWHRRQDGGPTCGSPRGQRQCYSCSTGMRWGPGGGPRERSRCEQTERCGWNTDGGQGTGWRLGDNGGGVGI